MTILPGQLALLENFYIPCVVLKRMRFFAGTRNDNRSAWHDEQEGSE